MVLYQITFPLYNFGYNLNSINQAEEDIDRSINIEMDIEDSDQEFFTDKIKIGIKDPDNDISPSVFGETAHAIAVISINTSLGNDIDLVYKVLNFLDPILKLISFAQKAPINIWNWVLSHSENIEDSEIKGIIPSRHYNTQPLSNQLLIPNDNIKNFIETSFNTLKSQENGFESSLMRFLSLYIESLESTTVDIKILILWTTLELLINKISSLNDIERVFDKAVLKKLKKLSFGEIENSEPVKKLFEVQETLKQKYQKGDPLIPKERYFLVHLKSIDWKTERDTNKWVKNFLNSKLDNREPIMSRIEFVLNELSLSYNKHSLKEANAVRNNIMHYGTPNYPRKIEQPLPKILNDFTILIDNFALKLLTEGIQI